MIFQKTSLLKNKDAIFLIFFSHFFLRVTQLQVFSLDSRQSVVNMASSSKRKRVVLSIEDKLTVCDLVRKKVSYSEINNRFNIGKSTTSDIVLGEEKLKSLSSRSVSLGFQNQLRKPKQ